MHYFCNMTLIFHFFVSGKKFWNLFHLQPMRDQKVQSNVVLLVCKFPLHSMLFCLLLHTLYNTLKQGEVQYFIGVQLDGSEYVEPVQNGIPEATAKENEKLVCDLLHLQGHHSKVPFKRECKTVSFLKIIASLEI